MINATLFTYKSETDTANDYIICPHCMSDAIRNAMDDPYIIHGRSYICNVCGAEIIVSPNTEEEIF